MHQDKLFTKKSRRARAVCRYRWERADTAGKVSEETLGLPSSPAVPSGPSAPAPVFFLNLSLSDVLEMHPWFFSSRIL